MLPPSFVLLLHTSGSAALPLASTAHALDALTTLEVVDTAHSSMDGGSNSFLLAIYAALALLLVSFLFSFAEVLGVKEVSLVRQKHMNPLNGLVVDELYLFVLFSQTSGLAQSSTLS